MVQNSYEWNCQVSAPINVTSRSDLCSSTDMKKCNCYHAICADLWSYEMLRSYIKVSNATGIQIITGTMKCRQYISSDYTAHTLQSYTVWIHYMAHQKASGFKTLLFLQRSLSKWELQEQPIREAEWGEWWQSSHGEWREEWTDSIKDGYYTSGNINTCGGWLCQY